MKRSLLAPVFVLFALFPIKSAWSLDQDQINKLVTEALRMCVEISSEGTLTEGEFKGKFELELLSSLKRLFGAETMANGGIKIENYNNVPRNELLSAMKTTNDCRSFAFAQLLKAMEKYAVPKVEGGDQEIGNLENQSYIFRPYLSPENTKKSFYFTLNRECRLIFEYPNGMGIAKFIQLWRNNESTPLIDTWIGIGSAPEQIDVPEGRYKFTGVLRDGYPPGITPYGVRSVCS